jgi:HPr Serine kinase C-terminal domain
MSLLSGVSCVAIGARAVLIEGSSGSGKSSLALALIDRGAVLVGDDGVRLETHGERLNAFPPPSIAGLLEVRNLGLLTFPTAADLPIALVLRLDSEAPRYVDAAEATIIAAVSLPLIRLWPDSALLAKKAELALERYGLA